MTSTYQLASPQADGRIYVTESHTDSIGRVHTCSYLADVGTDYQAIADARGLQIEESLKAAEARTATEGVFVEPVYQTRLQWITRVRELYRDSRRHECAGIAKTIMDILSAGLATDTQLRNAFGLTVTQWNTLKTKLTNLRTYWNELNNAAGE